MADSWEDEADDWEAEADRLEGLRLNEVDESRFAGEDEGVQDTWEDDVPARQPKKEVTNKYAAHDAADAERAAHSKSFDPNDPKAAMLAQADSEARHMAEELGVSTAAPAGPVIFGGQEPKSKADFEKYAADVAKHYGNPYVKNKQYRVLVKSLAKALCLEMEPEGIKEVEATLAGLRSDKLKEARQAAAGAKKGPKKTVKMETDDIAAGLEDAKYAYSDGDDDLEFM